MFRALTVFLINGEVTEILSKYGGVIRYTFWPGLGTGKSWRMRPMTPSLRYHHSHAGQHLWARKVQEYESATASQRGQGDHHSNTGMQ